MTPSNLIWAFGMGLACMAMWALIHAVDPIPNFKHAKRFLLAGFLIGFGFGWIIDRCIPDSLTDRFNAPADQRFTPAGTRLW